MKAGDITDEQILTVVDEIAKDKSWANRWEIAGRFPGLPFKVVSAKLNQMVNKKRLAGCACGHECRGDFHRLAEEKS